MSERRGGFPGVPYKAKEAKAVAVESKPLPVVEEKLPAIEEARIEALAELTAVSEELGLYNSEELAPKIESDESEIKVSKKKKKFNREEE